MVSFTHEQNIICSQTQLDYSRPLFVGNYLQATWWAIDQRKGEIIASNHNHYYDYCDYEYKYDYDYNNNNNNINYYYYYYYYYY